MTKSEVGKALASYARGVPKKLSKAERKRRSVRITAMNKSRKKASVSNGSR